MKEAFDKGGRSSLARTDTGTDTSIGTVQVLTRV